LPNVWDHCFAKGKTMIKHIILLILITSFCFSQGKTGLKGTKWICRVTDSCFDTLTLTAKGKYTDYSCEADERCFGKYRWGHDTLYLFQEKGEFDYQDSAEHRRGKALFKYILHGDDLRLVFSQPNLHILPKIIVDTSYVLRRLKY
jgi:hypothetical protein